jgi:hypothetical protein
MNNSELIEIYNDQKFYKRVEMAVFKWLRYWVSAGVTEVTIPDETTRTLTQSVIADILINPDRPIRKIAILAIQHDAITQADYLSDAVLKTAIDSIMGNDLAFIMAA